ncbi:MAG: helix-turn-helix domain-containing protein [Novosphingobium sp.]|nr:helix-turn-helix domain-containing protein [Novosphingobium sp.]
MARSSPGVRRIAAILGFMADHPGQAFALTDLVRALKLSRATCHALLTGLVEVGYLYRTTDKTYVLGPALMAIGRAAAGHFSPLQVAKPEMRSLADEYDVVCSALFLEGETIVSRERAASVSHVGYSLPLGTKVPLRPRSMPSFFAWSPREAAAKLDAADPPVAPAERQRIEAVMAFARANGYTVHVRSGAGGEDHAYMPGQNDAELPMTQLTELMPGERYALSSINSPVFGASGKIEFLIGMMGFNRSMTGEEIAAAAERLKAACARIGAFLAGGDRDAA